MKSKFKITNIFIFIFSCMLLLAIMVIDYLTGPGLSCSAFYLVPIFIVAKRSGSVMGILMASLGGLLWGSVHVLAGKSFDSAFAMYWDFAVRIALFGAFALVTSRLKAAREKKEHLVNVDEVTGIANWQAFSEVAAIEVERCRRYKRPLSIAYIDCDNFNVVNTSAGHLAGNAFLKAVAESVKAHIRTVDYVARIGGDGFIILYPEAIYEAAQKAIQRLLAFILEVPREKKWPITYSIGLASFTRSPESVDELVRRAEDLMHEAKRSGKNMIKHRAFVEEPEEETGNPV